MLRIKHISLLIAATAALLLAQSCGTPKDIVYLQDVEANEGFAIDTDKSIKAMPNDKIQIIVTSRDPELSTMFNLPIVTTTAGRSVANSYNQQVAAYVVTAEGYIDFPVLGEIHVEGLTREQIAKLIKQKIVEGKYLTDPVVTVDFLNLYFSVSGEVLKPGRYDMDRDQMTVLDGLSAAGDLTVYGQRTNVKVLRRVDGKQMIYVLDLTKAKDLADSPGFYLEQNDVIYVSPNPTRARQSTVNGNNVISTSFWLSLASVLTSVCVLIFR